MVKHSIAAVGLLITLIALWLAIGVHYVHFYEVLLVGLIFLLCPYAPSGTFVIRDLILTYVLFVVGGLFVDLGLGITLFHLWHYAYTSLFEYVVLYLFIYPVGGLVTLFSYLVVRRCLGEVTSIGRPKLSNALVIVALMLTTFAVFLRVQNTSYDVWTAFFLMALPCVTTAWFTEKHGGVSLLGELYGSPWKTMLALCIATLGNLLIHEYPNTFVHEWTYTPHTSGFLSNSLVGVPLSMWVLWPLLVIGPICIWYFVLVTRKRILTAAT